MTKDSAAHDKGVFEKMDQDDKVALKRFLTGQIQNILANEHGIGGSKGVLNEARRRVDERVDAVVKDDEMLEKLASLLARKVNVNFAKLVTDAAQKVAEQAIKKAAGDAAARVKISVFIEPDPQEPEEAQGFGAF